jgi:hypothetical protein
VKIHFRNEGETLRIFIEDEYDLFTIESIHELLKDDKKFIGVRRVLVDCSKLKTIDSFGGEIFLVKKKYDIERIEFIGLDNKLYPIFNNFSQQFFNEDLIRISC